jgi:hypothetical protein
MQAMRHAIFLSKLYSIKCSDKEKAKWIKWRERWGRKGKKKKKGKATLS